MGGDFVDRVTQLQVQVGMNDLVGSLERDQVYAHYQEAGVNRFTGGPLVYHRGGQARYQESSLYDYSGDYLELIAGEILDGGGTDAMASAMEKFDDYARQRCPVELEALCNSGHPTVTDNGAVTYDRAPLVPRLSEGELKANREHAYGKIGRK